MSFKVGSSDACVEYIPAAISSIFRKNSLAATLAFLAVRFRALPAFGFVRGTNGSTRERSCRQGLNLRQGVGNSLLRHRSSWYYRQRQRANLHNNTFDSPYSGNVWSSIKTALVTTGITQLLHARNEESINCYVFYCILDYFEILRFFAVRKRILGGI